MLLIFISAALFYFSFPDRIFLYGFAPCIFFFAVPLLLGIKDKPFKKRFGLMLLWGLAAYGLMGQGLFAISPSGYLAFVLALTLQSLFFACITGFTQNILANLIILPCAWGLSESLRNELMGGFSFDISHALSFSPSMLGLYAWIGASGMSVVIFLVNTLIYAALIDRKNWIRFTLGLVIIFLIIAAAGPKHPTPEANTKIVRVAVIQANISPLDKMDLRLFNRNAARHLFLTQEAAMTAHPDLVIWPETAFPDDLLQSDQWRPLIFNQAKAMDADILVGIAPIIDGKEYNSALLINTQGQIGGLYNKHVLLPFAETMPLEVLGLHWGRGFHFSAGNQIGLMHLSRVPLDFGVVICSESANPHLVHQLHQAGAQFLVEISNDGWFRDKASYMLHAQGAIMRAVENRMWVIRAANTGFSFAVSPDGVIYTDRNIKLGHEGFGIFDIMLKSSSG